LLSRAKARAFLMRQQVFAVAGLCEIIVG
jgi:hypothetical protein